MIAPVVIFPFPDGSYSNRWKFSQPRSWMHATEVWKGGYTVSGRGAREGFFVAITHDEDCGYWGDSAVGVWTYSVRDLRSE